MAIKKFCTLVFFFIQVSSPMLAAYTLPALGYSFDALEPHIDKESMRLHYLHHHQKDIRDLNAALEKYPAFSDKKIEELIKEGDTLPVELKSSVRNSGGSHFNHVLFWRTMSPRKVQPSEQFVTAISTVFGSMKELKNAFIEAGQKMFGSGWLWLCLGDESNLVLISTLNNDTPLTKGLLPLLCVDLWEHAYCLKYHNDRAAYLEAWWNVINWPEVESLYNTYISEKKMQKPFNGVLIIPGIKGDLAKRKLIPALYQMIKEGMRGIIVGLGRQESTVTQILDQARPFIQNLDQTVWDALTSMTHYFSFSEEKKEFTEIHKLIEQPEKEKKLSGQRIAYLAVPPDSFCSLTEQLTQAGIIKQGNLYHSIVYEKPFGSSGASAYQINECIKGCLQEEQIYRVDHYLAKGLVALLPSLCTSNDLLRRAWNNKTIKEISIYFDETIGMEGRGSFYDRYGALKDVVQNHILQLLALVTLDESDTYDVSVMHRRKAEFIQSLSIVEAAEGQYEGYLQEKDVNPRSTTETAVILKLVSSDSAGKGSLF